VDKKMILKAGKRGRRTGRKEKEQPATQLTTGSPSECLTPKIESMARKVYYDFE
jgi:hypothetical protein